MKTKTYLDQTHYYLSSVMNAKSTKDLYAIKVSKTKKMESFLFTKFALEVCLNDNTYRAEAISKDFSKLTDLEANQILNNISFSLFDFSSSCVKFPEEYCFTSKQEVFETLPKEHKKAYSAYKKPTRDLIESLRKIKIECLKKLESR